MPDVLFIIRFFRIVSPIPPLMRPAFAAVGAAAALLVMLDADRAAAAVIPLLLLQLFASSSGFMMPARRGHYDVLLTSGHKPVLVAAVHWGMSILPGIATWIAVAAVEIVATSGSRMVLLTPGTVAALLLVSTIPWSATVSLPRFTGAIGWLIVLTLLVVSLSADGAGGSLVDATIGSAWVDLSLSPTLYPPALVGKDVASLDPLQLLPPLILAAGSMIVALVWIARHDIPLEASQ